MTFSRLDGADGVTTAVRKHTRLSVISIPSVSTTCPGFDISLRPPILSYADVLKTKPTNGTQSAPSTRPLTSVQTSLPFCPPKLSSGMPYPPLHPSPLHTRNEKPHTRPYPQTPSPPTPSGANTYLAFLAEHILDNIASTSDERSLWALMATCQSLRHAATAALRPYLRRGVVAPRLRLSSDFFQPIDLSIVENDQERRAALRRVNRGYIALFGAYLPAASLLCELTIEVRSDDDETSWDLIQRFAPQLQRLDLYVVDKRWRIASEVTEAADVSSHIDDPLDVRRAWPRRLFRPPRLTFPLLTSLTITATARTFAHFARLAPCLPTLRDLTLSAHERDSVVLYFDPSETLAVARLPNLQHLTVAGNDNNVAMILRGILRKSSQVRRLIIHISNIPPFTNSTIRAIAAEVMGCDDLSALALYGVMAGGILPVMVRMELAGVGLEGPLVPDLTDLALEFDRKMPILHACPDIPGLRHLTFVDRSMGPDGYITLRPRKLVTTSFYDEADLRAVFAHYKHLKRVQWIVGYPTSPFGKNVRWPPQSVACYVDRPADENAPFRHSRPKLAAT